MASNASTLTKRVGTDKMLTPAGKAIAIAISLVLALGLVPGLTYAKKAYAAGDVNLSIGSTVNYAGYNTSEFYADGELAYCASPALPTPSGGTYAKQPVHYADAGENRIQGALYWGYGGPGFDKGGKEMFPARWYDGSDMTAERYIALTHIIISDIYAQQFEYAVQGCSQDFKDWVAGNVLGYNPYTDTWSADTTQGKIAAAGCPQSFADICYLLDTGSSTQIIAGRSYYPETGDVAVTKTSANESLTNGNSCYSLAGAVYGIYSDASCTTEVATITTGNDGKGTSKQIDEGSYYLKEKTAPKGYLLDSAVKPITITANQTLQVPVSDKPSNDPDRMRVWKQDAARSEPLPEGAASVANAEFTFKYYAGYYEANSLPANPTRTWVMKTNANGVARITDGNGSKISGDDFYLTAAGNITIPLGTITATETKQPDGYLLDDGAGNAPKTFVSWIVEDSGRTGNARVEPKNYTAGENLATYNTPRVSDTVKRGNYELDKSDSATPNGSVQGAATLAGAEFEIINNNDNAVISPQTGLAVEKGGVVCTIVTDENGHASTTTADINGWAIPDGNDNSRVDGNGKPLNFEGKALAYGTYTVRESKAPEGYNLNDSWTQVITIDNDGQVITGEVKDDIIRGDMNLVKVNERTMKRLSNIAFLVTSKTTGEAHVLVTDANGEISTEDNVHAGSTNANDAAWDGTTLDETKLNAASGIWFAGRVDGNGALVDNDLGALPYDTYTVRELPSSANEGLIPVEFDVTISKHGKTVNLGTIDDHLAPQIGTTLTDEGGSHTVGIGDMYVLTDVVNYSDFAPGTYTFKGELHAINADGSDAGVIATGEREVKITAANGTVEIAFTIFSTEQYVGKKLVATEQCFDAEGELVSEHADLEDEGQTATVPEIATTLKDAASDSHSASSVGHVTLVDTVEYKGLTPQKPYTMNMVLHKVNADGTDGGELVDAHGDVVKATTKFTPQEADGTVDVTVTFEPADGGGYSVVAFEELQYKGETYAMHADIADQNQTCSIVGIGTVALDKATGRHVAAADGVQIVDTVEYNGLVEGTAYKLEGEVHKITADGGDAVSAKDADSNNVVASTEFTASTASGTVDVTFDATIAPEAGCTYVVFEKLYRDDVVLAEHTDATSGPQSVYVPAIGTTAVSKDTGTHNAPSAGEITIVDTVAYTNLPTGSEYVLHATLHKVNDDGADGGVVKVGDKPVEATQAFEPDAPNGSVDVELTASAKDLPGKVVVFEDLYVKGANGETLVGSHADATDEGQTIYLTSINTTAKDKETGNHTGKPAKSVTVIDTVEYTGLEVGKEYKMVGTLMDKSTGKALKANDKEVTAEVKFTPKKSSGTVDMEFKVENKVMDDRTVVVFEKLYDANGKEVANHEDINSESQSVTYKKSSAAGEAFDKTGYWLAQYWWVIALAGIAIFGVGAINRARASKKCFRDDDE